MCARLEQLDNKAQAKLSNIQRRDDRLRNQLATEKQKLDLLQERRDVLTQLITIQRQTKQQQYNNNRSQSARSDVSSRMSDYSRPSTGSSVASYATFTSENLRLHNRIMERPEFVPKLNFGKLK